MRACAPLCRVLIADDDPQVLRVLARILRNAGFEVEATSRTRRLAELAT